MALVRISQQLLHDVSLGIREFAFNIQRQTINPLNPQMAESTFKGGDMYDFAMRKVWGDHVDLVPRLRGTGFTKEVSRIDLRIYNSDNRSFEVQVMPTEGKVTVPAFKSGWDYADAKATVEEMTALPWAAKFFEDKNAYELALREHNLKFENIENQVRSFLRNSKSLNDAIKKWPDIKLWIPADYLVKVEEVVERKSRADKQQQEAEEATAVIDTTLLTSMGVLKTIQAST